MDLKNIHTIQKSNLWRKITKHKAYRGFKIVHTEPNNLSHWCALWVFFTFKITDKTIKNYWKEGRMMIRTEGLDPHDLPIICYGKILVYS